MAFQTQSRKRCRKKTDSIFSAWLRGVTGEVHPVPWETKSTHTLVAGFLPQCPATRGDEPHDVTTTGAKHVIAVQGPRSIRPRKSKSSANGKFKRSKGCLALCLSASVSPLSVPVVLSMTTAPFPYTTPLQDYSFFFCGGGEIHA